LYHILAVCLSQTAGAHKTFAPDYKKSGRNHHRKSKLEKLHFQLKNRIMYNIFSHCYGTKITTIAELHAWQKADEAPGLTPPLNYVSTASNMISHILQFYITAIFADRIIQRYLTANTVIWQKSR
jgi:hypothetical protein